MKSRRNNTKDLEQQVVSLLRLAISQAEQIQQLENENKELDRKRKAWLFAAAECAQQLTRENTNETHNEKLDRPSSVQR